MTTFRAVFEGLDASVHESLWVTDGTAVGTSELTPGGANSQGIFYSRVPAFSPDFTVLASKALFEGIDASGRFNLWVTDGTSAGTSELAVAGASSSGLFGSVTYSYFFPNFTILGNKALFEGVDDHGTDPKTGKPAPTPGLWVTDGTSSGTSELTVAGASATGLSPSNFTVLGSKALFEGRDTNGHFNLWITDGTSAGTSELAVAGASGSLLDGTADNPPHFTVLGSKVLFAGRDTNGYFNLWITDGTSVGTSELTVGGAYSGGLLAVMNPDFTVLGNKALFEGRDASGSGSYNLWVTDGTSAGTIELTAAGASSRGLFNNNGNIVNPDFTVLGSKVLFAGVDASGLPNLWVTDGTSAGTSELAVAGASANYGLLSVSPNFVVLGGKVLFAGRDADDRKIGLWMTDGTSAGTSELAVAGAAAVNGLLSGGNPDFTVVGGKALFVGAGAHGGGLWVTDGTAAGTVAVSSSAQFISDITVLATSPTSPPPSPDLPWQTDGTSIFLQNDTGAAAIWTVSGAAFAGGGSLPNPGPSWHAKAPADFNGDGKPDILWQNDSGAVALWELNGTSIIGGGSLPNPGLSWQVASVGDFNGDGRSDILWQNSSGELGIWELNGASIIGGGSLPNPGPSWHATGSGDFNGDGKFDILWQNDSGQVAIWEMNGTSVIGGGSIANTGPSWHALGTGDFNGDGRSDIVFQNDSGQVAIWEMNGTSVIGGGNVANPGPSWHVMGVGDYNSDGKSDILFQNSSGEVAIWEMNGTSVIGGGSIANPGPSWHI